MARAKKQIFFFPMEKERFARLYWYLREWEIFENVVLKPYVLTNSNKLCFACISDLIFLPLLKRGKHFSTVNLSILTFDLNWR